MKILKSVLVLLGIAAVIVALAAIAPAMLLVAGVKYGSFKALAVYIILVLASGYIFRFIMETLYMIAIHEVRSIDRHRAGYVIFNIVSVFLAAVFIDSVMDQIEMRTISALIFAAGYVILCELLERIIDNIDEEGD